MANQNQCMGCKHGTNHPCPELNKIDGFLDYISRKHNLESDYLNKLVKWADQQITQGSTCPLKEKG